MTACANQRGFDIGSEVRLIGTFTDIAGALADPTTVLVRIKDPDGNITVENPVRQSIGVYYQDLIISLAGIWYYRFEGTGNVVAAGDSSFSVYNSPILS